MDRTVERLLFAAGGDMSDDQAEFAIPGTYSLTVPPNVTSMSIVTIQGGQGGAAAGGNGGTLRYINNVAVVPGEVLTIDVGVGGAGAPYPTSGFTTKGTVGGHSAVRRGGTTIMSSNPGLSLGTGFTGGIGGSGFASSTNGSVSHGGGGGGAAGYAGAGGNGASGTSTAATAGTGGAGGGGAINTVTWVITGSIALGEVGGSGGSTGTEGQGANGAAAVNIAQSSFDGPPGGTGSVANTNAGGGGGGGRTSVSQTTGEVTYLLGSKGSDGAVRLIWPGTIRQFPSTRTASE